MNVFASIARFFISNRKLSFLILVIIFLWGALSFKMMPKQYNPNIVAPAFLINVDFPNATVDEVYRLVTQPLEDVLSEIPGVEDIYSKSYHGGRSSVVVQFYVGQDMEKSTITLRQKLSSRIDLSPVGAGEPYISAIDPEDLPIKTLALYSEKLDPVDLRQRAHALKEDIKLINGVSLVNIIGGRRREISIVLDLEKMKKTKTSLDEIQQALERTSLLKDLGVIKSKENYYTLEMGEQADTVDDIKNIIIASNFDYQLRIKDVAEVKASLVERSSYVNYLKDNKKYQDAVYVAISKLKGKNIVDVSNAIDKTIDVLKTRKPYFVDLKIDTVKDEGKTADEEIKGLVLNLAQAITIVFVVLFLFLNHRAAMIVAFSIPMTLLTVFGVGNLFGYTINRITLFALILSLGMLVDSATVVIENIVSLKKRNIDEEKEMLIPSAVAEIGTGLMFSTLTTVLAFIPMRFVSGMMGPYMGPIPFFVSTALIVSLIYAYTLNPWLAYLFCSDNIKSEVDKKCGFLCAILTKNVLLYRIALESLLSNKKVRVRFLTICFVALLISLSLPVFKLLRFRMLPKADRPQVYLQIDLNRGVSVESAQNIADRAIAALSDKNIKSIQTFTAVAPVLDFNGMFRGVDERFNTNNITLKLNLVHQESRKKASEDIAFEYRQRLLNEFKNDLSVRFVMVEDPPGPPVKSTFQVKIKSADKKLLYAVSSKLENIVKQIKGIEDVDNSIMESNTKYLMYVDKTAAARADVDVASISNDLETVFKGRNIAVVHSDFNFEQEYAVLRIEKEKRDSIADLDNIYVVNKSGLYIPMSSLVKISTAVQEDVYINDNREKTVYISGEMGKRSVMYACLDLISDLKNFNLSGRDVKLLKMNLFELRYLVDGKDEFKIELGGEWDITIAVFRDLGLAMLIALVLIYLVLVAQFRSFLIPGLIFVTIPLALIGVLPGFSILFALKRIYFSATSMIGVIALSGIVVNNAIIFIEHVKQSANKFDNLKDLLLDSGLTRMRPILLTSITTILGSLVIASDPVWSGLAWSIVFGLSLSSLLTLLVFPCLVYHFLNDNWQEVFMKKNNS